MNKKPIYFTKSGNARFYGNKCLLNSVIEVFVKIDRPASLVAPSYFLGGVSIYLTTLISLIICLL